MRYPILPLVAALKVLGSGMTANALKLEPRALGTRLQVAAV